MPVQVTKKDRETSQNLVHRFTKTVRQSGILLQVRGKQFRKRPKSVLAKKRSALRRVILRAEKKRVEKLSKPSGKSQSRNW
ncbi:MAG: hypothetical protein EXS52_02205 [Candidatus Staskawiczbacteria bacterium]|nr:hypothetical protein [Candidatus Staskawiczbacteria bacterium]